MKLKDLTGELCMGEAIKIIEVVPFSIVDNVVFRGKLFAYFESDMFKQYGKRTVLSISVTSENYMEIRIIGEQK